MESLINNLINGNLTDARRQARRFSQGKIVKALLQFQFSEVKALRAALYLKTGEGFQAYCDAE
jgi:hypothetical protein